MNHYTPAQLAEQSKELLGQHRAEGTIRSDLLNGRIPSAEQILGRFWVIPKTAIPAYKKWLNTKPKQGRPKKPKEFAWLFPPEKLALVESLVAEHGGEIIEK